MNCFQLLNFVAPKTLIIAAAPAGEPAILLCVLGALNIIGF